MAYEKSKVSSFGGGSLDSTPVVGFEYCHQFSRIAGEVPDASTLGEGEIAINLADGILYIRGANGSVVAAGGVAGGSAANQVVSPGGISNLTTAQQGEIVVGTIVTTTDGRRWVYKGQGSKTLEASYIELADITPAWSAISDKPSTFTPSSHSHSISDVTGLQTAIDQKVSSAPQWTQSHTSENGTQYAVNDVVYAGGNIYRAIAANDSIEVTNPSYWTLVGAGYRINISGADIDGLPSQLPSSANDGDVLTYDTNLGYWVAEAPGGGGGGGDYLPLTGGTMTGNIAFDGTSGQAIGKGWFDSNRGGNYGISLYCSIGYQLNWQAGWLSTTEQDLATRRPLYLDSAAGTTLRAWDASENKGVEVSHINIAFADGTTQGSAGIIAPQGSMTDGYVLTWSDSSSAWIAAAPSGGGGASLPSGSNTGDLLTYDSSTASWVASSLANVLPTTGVDGTVMMWNSGTWTAASIPSQLPTSASNNDVLAWNGSSWVAVMPSTPGLPSASSGQYLTFNGSNWVAGSSPLPNGTADGETLYWNTATSTWSSAPVLLPDWNAQVGYAVGQLAAYDGRLWRATNTGMGNTPADGSGYWTAITASSSLPAGSDGNVLTYDSGASAWIAAAPVAELPEAPGDGKVLTYSTNASAWIAADPPPVELYDFLTANETMETSGAASSLSLHLASGGAYVVEGVASISNAANDEMIFFGLRLLAQGSDGEVYLEVDTLSGDSIAVFRLPVVADQSITTVVSGTYANATYRVPFRALVRVSPSVSSTDVAVWYGGGGDVVTIHAGSWMSARRVTLYD